MDQENGSARRGSAQPQRGIGRRTPPAAATAADAAASANTITKGNTTSTAVPPSTTVAAPAATSTSVAAPTGSPATSDPTPATTAVVTNTPKPPLSEPARVRIPSIGVDAPLIPVGLKNNGEMVVPETVAGWYDLGPKPGEAGPAVIVAHRSWSGQPGVFHRLDELSPNDLVEVLYESGRVERFGVETSETHLKSQLPVKSIWNDARQAVLRVITCGGTFNQRTRHYDSNIIVFASSLD